MLRRRMTYGGVDKNTILLIHGKDGAVDASGNKIALVINGNVSVNTSVKKFNASLNFLSINFGIVSAAIVPAMAFGTQNFTIDFWVNYSSQRTMAVFNTGTTYDSGSGIFVALQSGKVVSYANAGAGTVIEAAIPVNTWTHIAIIRYGSQLRLYVNGVLQNSMSFSYSLQSNQPFLFGYEHSGIGSLAFNGYIEEFRVSNIARWTSNFTPPTKPY